MPARANNRSLQEAIERLVRLRVSILLGEVSREAAPALLHEIEAELLRLGITEERLPSIRSDVARTAGEIAAVRIAESEASRIERMNDSPIPSRREELTSIIQHYERRSDLRLTGSARSLLRIPVLEFAELTDEWNAAEFASSIEVILQAVRQANPTELDERANKRTSTSVLKAIHNRWCNIPPFCDKTRVERGGR
jgi:hypothetical protein